MYNRAGALPGFESDKETFGTLSAAPFGSSLILPISYAYIAMMGSEGLTEVSRPARCPWQTFACAALSTYLDLLSPRRQLPDSHASSRAKPEGCDFAWGLQQLAA